MYCSWSMPVAGIQLQHFTTNYLYPWEICVGSNILIVMPKCCCSNQK